MIVAVAALCENGEPGTHVIDEPEGIHLEEIVLQISGPNGGPVIHTCLPDQTVNAYGQGSVTVQVTTPANMASYGRSRLAKTFVELTGAPGITQNSQRAYSLVELSVNPNGGALNASFPHQLSSSSAVKNTTQSPLSTPNVVDVLFGNPGTRFYTLDHNDAQARNQADFQIVGYHIDGIEITTRNCFEGKLSSAEGPLGLMADQTNDRDLMHNTLKTKTPDFTVGPNPVADRLNVTLQEKGLVTIIDMTGRVWFRESAYNPTLSVNVNSWPAGTYILRHDTSFGTLVQRFLKL